MSAKNDVLDVITQATAPVKVKDLTFLFSGVHEESKILDALDVLVSKRYIKKGRSGYVSR